MKVITLENEFLAYEEILRNLQANHLPLVMWQNDPLSGERVVSKSKLDSYSMDLKLLHLNLPLEARVENYLPLYCYSEDKQIIFKTTIHEVRDSQFSVLIPHEIKYLEGPENQAMVGRDLGKDIMKVKRLNLGSAEHSLGGYIKVKSMAKRSARDQEYLKNEFAGLSLDEEEKLFSGMRETPRARPKKDKFVRIKLAKSDSVHRPRLFDLSQGGMSFVTLEAELFPKGSEIHLMGIDEHELDDPVLGTIMSHRPIDELNGEWKIGIRFEEGQD